MASNVRELRNYTPPDSGPQSTLSVVLSSSSSSQVLSLHTRPSTGLAVNLSVRQVQSERARDALTVGAIANIFDPDQILEIRVLALTNVESGERVLLYTGSHSPHVRSHIKLSWTSNIRDDIKFVSIPSLESGEGLVLQFDMSIQILRDLWEYREMKKTGRTSYPAFPFTTPGKWRLHFASEDSIGFIENGPVLWTWGDLTGNLQGKKFEYPYDERYEFEPGGEERMDAERQEGMYVQLHPNYTSKVEHFVAVEADTDGIVIEFVD